MDPLYEKEQAGEDREPVSLRERLRTFLFSRYFSATLLGVAALVLVVFVTKNLHSSKTTIHEETDVNQQDLLHKESKPFQADTVAQKGETDSSTQKRSLEHWTKQSHTLPGAEVTIFEEKREPDQATQLIEYRFYFPDAFVDLSALVDGLISGFAFTKVRRLKIRRIPGVVERSFIGALGGVPDQRVEIIATQQRWRQQVFVLATPVERFEVIGGRELLEETFFSEARLERVSAPMREREQLLASGDPNEVLAKNIHGVPLTESLFGTLVRLTENMVGTLLVTHEIKEFREKLVRAWRSDDSAEVAQDVLETKLATMKSKDMIKQIQLSEALFIETYLQEKQKKEFSPMITLALKIDPVVAEYNGTVLTERALEARLQSVALWYEWSGADGGEIAAAVAEVRRLLTANYESLPQSSREKLHNAVSRTIRLLAGAQHLSPPQRIEKANEAYISSNKSASPIVLAEYFEEEMARTDLQNEIFNFVEMMGGLDALRSVVD